MSLLDLTLHPELLYLFVLGPGTGETVLLRVPANDWIVIDSFTNAGRPAAERIINEFGGNVAAVVLTHPHQDHCHGFIELIDASPRAVIGCVHPSEGTNGGGIPNDPIALLKERAKPTYTRVWEEWQRNTNRKWQTFRHQLIQVGDGTLTSLHPTRPLSQSDWLGASCNDLSSAMRFVWNNVILLLGADVTNASWPDIALSFNDLSNHCAMKVPHHASREAIHESYGHGDSDRKWIITPFASRRLPRSADDHGLARVLQYVDTAHLTSLPYSHDHEHLSPCKTSRTDIETDTVPKRLGPVTDDPGLRSQRYIVLAYDKSGELQRQWNGCGTLEVSE